MYVWLNRYKDALVLLLREVLNRIQFRYNQAQLEELDDETLDDDVRTIDKFHSLSCTFLVYTVCYKVIYNTFLSLNILFHLVTIATDRVAKVPASESGGGCQGDGATPIPCIFYSGKRLLVS